MKGLISVKIDESEVMKLCKEKISDLLKNADSELVFWDSAELMKRTCMSWNTVQSTFFFDKRFVKRKVGGKWYFPAREAKEFLETWLQEQ